jgi:hypothetical protein
VPGAPDAILSARGVGDSHEARPVVPGQSTLLKGIGPLQTMNEGRADRNRTER